MLQVIDPSVADEDDPFSTVPELDMYHPDNGWRPWPEPCSYDPAWVETYRAAQRARVARIDAIAKASIAEAAAAVPALKATDASTDPIGYREARRRAVFTKYLTIYRTLADPAYLDLSIDPDDRAMGSLFAFPDPFDANYGRGGLARTMTARGWLSTWSGLSSGAKLADTMPQVTVPTLLIHPTADTEIRVWQAEEIVDAAGADDVTYIEMKGALHYLEGDRPEAMQHVVDWLRPGSPDGAGRVPSALRSLRTVAKFRVRRAWTVREVLEGLGLPAEAIDEAERAGTAELLGTRCGRAPREGETDRRRTCGEGGHRRR